MSGVCFCGPGNIRVFCRCRPMSPADAGNGAKSVVEFEGDRNGEPEIVVRTGQGMRKNFKFDRAFTPTSDQCECCARFDSVQGSYQRLGERNGGQTTSRLRVEKAKGD